MPQQVICIQSEDVESGILVATFCGKSSRTGNPTGKKARKQSSKSRKVTSTKPRVKHLKLDGDWKIVFERVR
jgi:hypothetical protein